MHLYYLPFFKSLFHVPIVFPDFIFNVIYIGCVTRTMSSLHIQYNDVPITITNVTPLEHYISANVISPSSRPNVKMSKRAILPHSSVIEDMSDTYVVHYQATKLYIGGADPEHGQGHDGELIVEHRPLSSDKTLYVCFLLKTTSNIGTTLVDQLLTHHLSSNQLDVVPQQLVLSLQNWFPTTEKYLEQQRVHTTPTGDYVLVVPTMIPIQTKMNGKFQQPVTSVWLPSTGSLKHVTTTFSPSTFSHPRDQVIHEGFVEGNCTGGNCDLTGQHGIKAPVFECTYGDYDDSTIEKYITIPTD